MAKKLTKYDLRRANDGATPREADRALESLNGASRPAASKPGLGYVHVKLDKGRATKVKLPIPAKAAPAPRRDAPAAELADNPAFDGLPALTAEIAAVAGLDAAATLTRDRGGNRVYIPSSAADDHWLVRLVGREAADKLMAHFAQPSGIELELPRGPTGAFADVRRRVCKMIREGATSTQITRTVGVSRDMVKDYRRKMRVELEGEQLSLVTLFDALPAPPTRPGLADPDQPALLTDESEVAGNR